MNPIRKVCIKCFTICQCFSPTEDVEETIRRKRKRTLILYKVKSSWTKLSRPFLSKSSNQIRAISSLKTTVLSTCGTISKWNAVMRISASVVATSSWVVRCLSHHGWSMDSAKERHPSKRRLETELLRVTSWVLLTTSFMREDERILMSGCSVMDDRSFWSSRIPRRRYLAETDLRKWYLWWLKKTCSWEMCDGQILKILIIWSTVRRQSQNCTLLLFELSRQWLKQNWNRS